MRIDQTTGIMGCRRGDTWRYTAEAIVTNTSESPVLQVCAWASVDGTTYTRFLGTLAPGASRTAVFELDDDVTRSKLPRYWLEFTDRSGNRWSGVPGERLRLLDNPLRVKDRPPVPRPVLV